MLALAEIGPRDVVYDLGSGDGRIVIHAAERYGARGVGVEIDPILVWFAVRSARRAGVDDRVTFLRQDALTVDVAPATVVTLYLTPAANLRLRPILQAQLRPGARVVSHAHDMGDWRPDRSERVVLTDGAEHTIHLWRIRGSVVDRRARLTFHLPGDRAAPAAGIGAPSAPAWPRV
jgi:SAM-dependent methyltransferase